MILRIIEGDRDVLLADVHLELKQAIEEALVIARHVGARPLPEDRVTVIRGRAQRLDIDVSGGVVAHEVRARDCGRRAVPVQISEGVAALQLAVQGSSVPIAALVPLGDAGLLPCREVEYPSRVALREMQDPEFVPFVDFGVADRVFNSGIRSPGLLDRVG